MASIQELPYHFSTPVTIDLFNRPSFRKHTKLEIGRTDFLKFHTGEFYENKMNFVVFFLVGDSLAFEFYAPTQWNYPKEKKVPFTARRK